jgi:hypothetical protein
MDMAFFPFVEGSMTSPDGKVFMLHVKRDTGGDLLLGFPHVEISNIVKYAAMQASNGKDAKRRKVASTFKASSFELGRGPDGEAVLTLTVGQSGKISFLLPTDMPGQLSVSLHKLAN